MQSKEYQKLRECPFCGGKAMLINVPSIGIVYIQCGSCTAAVGRRRRSVSTMIGREFFTNKKEAIEAWNRRHDDGNVR